MCVLAALLLVAAGCAGGRDGAGGSGPVISIVERDFHIGVPSAEDLPSGDLRLSVENRGPETHEFVLIRASGANLRLRPDGITLNEDDIEPFVVGELEGAGPGTVRELRVHLEPGHYVMYCNMAGHYLGGMRTDVVVR
jgi:uncharacterized cupredoxin-like copper-binding protein